MPKDTTAKARKLGVPTMLMIWPNAVNKMSMRNGQCEKPIWFPICQSKLRYMKRRSTGSATLQNTAMIMRCRWYDIVDTSWKDANSNTLMRALLLDDWAMVIVWSQIWAAMLIRLSCIPMLRAGRSARSLNEIEHRFGNTTVFDNYLLKSKSAQTVHDLMSQDVDEEIAAK